MKTINFFIIALTLFTGCQKIEEEEERLDLDRMATEITESTSHLAGEPVISPQETLP